MRLQALTGVALALKPICYAIASEVLPRKYRALVQYWISILAGLGGLIGALVGPALLQLNAKEGWRWYFYLEGAIFIISLLGILIFVSRSPSFKLVALDLTFDFHQVQTTAARC